MSPLYPVLGFGRGVCSGPLLVDASSMSTGQAEPGRGRALKNEFVLNMLTEQDCHWAISFV